MRWSQAILLLALAAGLALGPVSALLQNGLSSHQFDILVSGADQVQFSGRYIVVKANGQVVTGIVDGVTPYTLRMRGHLIVAAFQKADGAGRSLEVHLLKDGRQVSHSGTGLFSGLPCVLSR